MRGRRARLTIGKEKIKKARRKEQGAIIGTKARSGTRQALLLSLVFSCISRGFDGV